MDKKIINLIICVLICVVVVLGLIIHQLVTDNSVKETEKVQNQLEEMVISDPVEGDFKIHRSENGYTVKYPANMQAKSLAKAIDFILDDAKSGSSLNIITAKNDGSLKSMTRDEFEYSFKNGSMSGAVLHSFENIVLNNIDATVAKFTYNENNVTQTIIIRDDYGYNITVTESSNISREMSQIFNDVVQSFTLD